MQPADTAYMYAAGRGNRLLTAFIYTQIFIYLSLSESQRVSEGWGVGRETAKILLLHLTLPFLLFPLKVFRIVVYGFQDKILPL